MVGRIAYLLFGLLATVEGQTRYEGITDLLALTFLLLRFRRRTRFFLHFALILTVQSVSYARVSL